MNRSGLVMIGPPLPPIPVDRPLVIFLEKDADKFPPF